MKPCLIPFVIVFAALAAVTAPAGAAFHHRGKSDHPKTAKSTMPTGPAPTAPLAVPGVPAPPELADQAAYVLMDAKTGAIIAEKASALSWPPASLTKLMTAYLTYQALGHGTLTIDQHVQVSDIAWHTGGSRMFISPGIDVTVDQLLHGLIIDSGNDAAVALAEAVAGSQSAFVGLMNDAAAKLHLTGTHYANVDGLPDPTLKTTAMDVAQLSRAILQQYPQYLKISVEQFYTFDKIRQRSWNPVLFHDPSVDGLKTGRTKEAGHCIDATAHRDGRRLIAVVLGGPSFHASTHDVEALLDYGFQFYTNAIVATAGKPVGLMPAPAFAQASLPVTSAHDVAVTMAVQEAKTLKTAVVYDPPKSGPIAKGQIVGTITVTAGGKEVATAPAVAMAADPRAGFLTRMTRRIHKAF